MPSLPDHQPLKALYIFYFATSLAFVKAPIWFIRYFSPSQRPRPGWSIKRAMIVRAMQELVPVTFPPGKTDPPPREVPDTTVDPTVVRLKGISGDVFCGEVRRFAQTAGVEPTDVAGYWLLKEGSQWSGNQAKPGEKTVLHIHGGAFYLGSGKPSDITANFPRGLLEHSRTLERTLAVDYRLTASAPNPPANPFPAALLDSLAAYRYLVQDAKFEPSNITVAGDSSGGNLAVALLLHLVENTIPDLPPPGRLVAASPWLDLDLSGSRKGPGSSAALNAPTDTFDEELMGKYGVISLLGEMPPEDSGTNRYLSPVSARLQKVPDFKRFPKTYVVAGGAERLLDDSKALAQQLRNAGVHVTEAYPPDATHDFVAFTWHEPERTEVLKEVAEWIDNDTN